MSVQPDSKHMNRKESIEAFVLIFQMKKFTGSEKVTCHKELVEVNNDACWAVVEKAKKVSHDREVGVETWSKIKGGWKVIKTLDHDSKMNWPPNITRSLRKPGAMRFSFRTASFSLSQVHSSGKKRGKVFESRLDRG